MENGTDPETPSETSEKSILSNLNPNTEGCFKFVTQHGDTAFKCVGWPIKMVYLFVALFIQIVGMAFAITMLALDKNDTCLYDSIIVGVLAFSAGLVAPSPILPNVS